MLFNTAGWQDVEGRLAGRQRFGQLDLRVERLLLRFPRIRRLPRLYGAPGPTAITAALGMTEVPLCPHTSDQSGGDSPADQAR